MNATARALYEAHVRHSLAAFDGAMRVARLDAWITDTFAWLGSVTVREAIAREQIDSIIDRYVIQLRISGGITELAGEMSNRVFASATSAATRVDDVLPSADFEAFAEKVVALEHARSAAIRLVAQSDAYRDLIVRILSRGISELVLGPDESGARARVLAALAGAIGSAPDKLLAGLERQVASRLEPFLERHAARIASESEDAISHALDAECIRGVADDIWQVVAPMRLGEAFAFISSHDLEDFVVLGYEFWLKYRKTKYFRAICGELVGFFFEKYGDESVASVIEDMGVSAEMIRREAQEIAGPLVDAARASGYLERQIRASLEPFYDSQAVAAVFAAHEKPLAPER